MPDSGAFSGISVDSLRSSSATVLSTTCVLCSSWLPVGATSPLLSCLPNSENSFLGSVIQPSAGRRRHSKDPAATSLLLPPFQTKRVFQLDTPFSQRPLLPGAARGECELSDVIGALRRKFCF